MIIWSYGTISNIDVNKNGNDSNGKMTLIQMAFIKAFPIETSDWQ